MQLVSSYCTQNVSDENVKSDSLKLFFAYKLMKVCYRHFFYLTMSLFQVTLHRIFQAWWEYYTTFHIWTTSVTSGSYLWFTPL